VNGESWIKSLFHAFGSKSSLTFVSFCIVHFKRNVGAFPPQLESYVNQVEGKVNLRPSWYVV